MLARHLAGDVSAFPELVQRFGPSVLGYFSQNGLERTAAEDLFQEAFARVHLHANRYDARRPFRNWFFAIAHNLLCSYLRRQRIRSLFSRRRRQDEAEPAVEVAAPACCNPEGEATAHEQMEIVRSSLQNLPAPQRQALLLTVVEGLSHEEAAQILDVPVPTLKTWVRRGRIRLAAALAGFEVLS